MSLHDGGGLLLFVKPSGTKTWRFRYYHPQTKKRTTLTFGSYPAISLADARQMREAAKALLEKSIDPQFWPIAEIEQAIKEAAAGDFVSSNEMNNLFKKLVTARHGN